MLSFLGNCLRFYAVVSGIMRPGEPHRTRCGKLGFESHRGFIQLNVLSLNPVTSSGVKTPKQCFKCTDSKTTLKQRWLFIWIVVVETEILMKLDGVTTVTYVLIGWSRFSRWQKYGLILVNFTWEWYLKVTDFWPRDEPTPGLKRTLSHSYLCWLYLALYATICTSLINMIFVIVK